MSSYARHFGPFEERVWLNTAHQGALPRIAAAVAREAVAWKVKPYELTDERFASVPRRLRKRLGQLINVPAEDIILANSCSYGLHLLANGIPWQPGDEVLVVRGDFPSTILPWLGLRKRGVVVRQIEPRGDVLKADDVTRHRTKRTRLLCTTWVHSFTGYAVDEQALGALCRAHGITFVLNGSQGIGARPLDVSTAPVDALTAVGFKWLCGPYGTGFCWIHPALRETLDYNQVYWLAMQSPEDLEAAKDPVVPDDLGARQYDIFGTANFFNFTAWTAALAYLLDQGLDAICTHDDRLVARFIDGLDTSTYELLSPRTGPARTPLVFVTHRDPARNRVVYERLREAGIYVSMRHGRLRISPHLYNTEADIDHALNVLHA